MFAVILFDGTHGVDVVHKKWLISKKKCSWPPYKGNKLRKSLLEGEDPRPDWKQYSISILGHYESYEKACRKCIHAEDIFNPETETSDEERQCKKRRKKLAFSDSEEESDSLNSGLSLPPPIKNTTREGSSQKKIVNTDDPLQEYEILFLPWESQSQLKPANFWSRNETASKFLDQSNNCPITVLPQHRTSSQGSIVPKNCSSSLSLNTISANVSTHEPVQDEASDCSSSLSLNTTSANVSTHEPLQDEATSTKSQLYKTMLEIQRTLKEHTKLLHQILNKEDKEVESCSPEFIYQLPVKSLEEFSAAENAIQDEAIFTSLVKHLGNAGGSDVKRVTRSVCQSLLTDEVASRFNWAGRGEKERFKDFKLRSLILYAVKQNIGTRDAAVKDIEGAIKDWMKYAPARMQLRAKKITT